MPIYVAVPTKCVTRIVCLHHFCRIIRPFNPSPPSLCFFYAGIAGFPLLVFLFLYALYYDFPLLFYLLQLTVIRFACYFE